MFSVSEEHSLLFRTTSSQGEKPISHNYRDTTVPLCDWSGHSINHLDCDDSSKFVNPLQSEIASNDIDEDCDSSWHCISDQDGDQRAGLLVHDQPCGSTYPLTEIRDCDESNPNIHFDATEIAGNNVDEDCSGDVLCYQDSDGDDLGSLTEVLSSDTDCNDFGEAGDSLDCDDSLMVGAFTAGPVAWFADSDNDGFGDPTGAGGVSCTGPPGYVNNSDDTTSSRRPTAFEACGDDIDANCDGYNDRAACHLDACEPLSGLTTTLYQAGTRDPDADFAPGPLPPSLRIEGLYAGNSETQLKALGNLRLAIDPNTGEANLGGRFEVTGLNSPNGGGGTLGDVWTLSMTLTPSTCSGCSPMLNDQTSVHAAVPSWQFYSVSDAKLSSHSLVNLQNEFTYEHTLTARSPQQPLQVGPSASGESLRCGLRFEFDHAFDFGAGTFSGQGKLVLGVVATPGAENLASAGAP